jgi:hypothetical protein
VTSSADGSILAAAAYPGGIYTWESPPILTLVRSGGNALVAWQNLSSASGLVLQETPDLTAATWTAAPNPLTLTNGMNQVSIPLSATGNYYFRLVGP